jgi:hypothetical protein
MGTLCGKEYCPLRYRYRTAQRGAFAGMPRRSDRRLPVEVTVAPLRNAEGEVVEGLNCSGCQRIRVRNGG